MLRMHPWEVWTIGGTKYTEFGTKMFEIANRNKGIRGPYRVASFMEEEAS
jgi:hypothetical protein